MTQRRSLSSALDVTPEKLAFIHGAQPSIPQVAEPTAADQPSPMATRRTTPVRPPKAIEKQRERPTAQEGPFVGEFLVPLTTRLQPKTADALRRAYLEQKLNRRRPDTQQEIIEAALQGWLRKEGFL